MSEELTPITRKEMYLAKAVGQSVPELTPITREEKFLQMIVDKLKEGGASPEDIEQAVEDYLKENPPSVGGVSSWNDIPDKPFTPGVAYTVVQPAIKPAYFSEGGYFTLNTTFDVIDGETYIVDWNGTEYTCVCAPASFQGISILGLGNVGAVTDGANTGEPFAIGVVLPQYTTAAGFSVGVIPLDDSTDITFSVTRVEEVDKIDWKCTPPVDYLAEYGQPGHILNRPCYKVDEVILLENTEIAFKNGSCSIRKVVPFVPGEEYQLTAFDGAVTYVSTGVAGLMRNETTEAVACRFDIGGSFAIDVMSSEALTALIGAQTLIQAPIQDDIPLTIEIKRPKKVKQLDPEVVPNLPVPAFDLVELGMKESELYPTIMMLNTSKTEEICAALLNGPVRLHIPTPSGAPSGTISGNNWHVVNGIVSSTRYAVIYNYVGGKWMEIDIHDFEITVKFL